FTAPSAAAFLYSSSRLWARAWSANNAAASRRPCARAAAFPANNFIITPRCNKLRPFIGLGDSAAEQQRQSGHVALGLDACDFFDDPFEPLPRQGGRAEADELLTRFALRQRIVKISLRRRQITFDGFAAGERNLHPAGEALFVPGPRIGV